MGVATFNHDAWAARFPEFAQVPTEVAQMYWDEATLFFRNDGTIPTTNGQQGMMLNLLTAHIASLYRQSTADPAPGDPKNAGLVGRISSATQGSVTVQAELSMTPTTSGMQAWCTQTQYGLQFWAATAAFRSLIYVPGRLQYGAEGVPGVAGLPWYVMPLR